VAVGQQQDQYNAYASMPIPLCKPTVSVYRNELEAESPKEPCNGGVDEAVAEPGFICFYRSGNYGSLESQDKNAAFVGFQDAVGNNYTSEGAPAFNELGTIAVFRTKEFKVESPKPVLAKEAYLVASGSWGATAK
jgi:hypothetical protein